MKHHYNNKWNDEPQIHGGWFIDTDGVTVLQWTCTNGADDDILLSDGRILSEHQYDTRAFASHPDQNPNIGKDSSGVYFCTRTNQSFKIGGE